MFRQLLGSVFISTLCACAVEPPTETPPLSRQAPVQGAPEQGSPANVDGAPPDEPTGPTNPSPTNPNTANPNGPASTDPNAIVLLSAANADATKFFLPPYFTIWSEDGAVANRARTGWARANLHNADLSKEVPGCYVVCYTKDATHGTYSTGGGVFVAGQVRVSGSYDSKGICRPTGFETADISTAQAFKDKCNQGLPTYCPTTSSCWAGGDTKQWFNLIQP